MVRKILISFKIFALNTLLENSPEHGGVGHSFLHLVGFRVTFSTLYIFTPSTMNALQQACLGGATVFSSVIRCHSDNHRRNHTTSGTVGDTFFAHQSGRRRMGSSGVKARGHACFGVCWVALLCSAEPGTVWDERPAWLSSAGFSDNHL